MLRRFELIRYEDKSGISGTGKVAVGVRFDNGKSVISWNSEIHSIEIYDSIEEILKIHGHENMTNVNWIDP